MLLVLYFVFTSTFVFKLYTLEGAHFRCVLCPDSGALISFGKSLVKYGQ